MIVYIDDMLIMASFVERHNPVPTPFARSRDKLREICVSDRPNGVLGRHGGQQESVIEHPAIQNEGFDGQISDDIDFKINII